MNFVTNRFSNKSHLIDNYLPVNFKIITSGIDYFIAGGICTSVFSGNQINDIDIFFPNNVEMLKMHLKLKCDDNYKLAFSSDNAESYSCNGKKIQLIKKLYGTPEYVMSKFDYTVVMCARTNDNTFIFSDKFFENLADKTLIFNADIAYPIASLIRSRKYINRGYKFPTVEMVKIAFKINSLKMETYKDVKEQLEGIDTLLLKELTDSLIENKDKTFDFTEFLVYIDEYLNKYYTD
jgi:hypothetical protein